MAHSASFGKTYDQYFLSIYKGKLTDGVYQRLRFYTKKDLINFFNIVEKDAQNELSEKTLFDFLIKTAHEWGGDKKLKTRRLLSQICMEL